MLLRWLVNQYVRDAAEGKVRQVVGELTGRIKESPTSLPLPRGEGRGEGASALIRDSISASTSNESSAEQAAADPLLPTEVAFLFALGIESGGLVDLLRGAETSRHAHGVEHAGKLNGREVVIVEAGVGQRAAARGVREAIKFYQPKWVISTGFAGGLVDELRRGHILMADEVVSEAGERIDVGLKLDRQSLAGSKGIHVGPLLTIDRILRQPAERRRLAEQHRVLGCDMETFAIAAACRELNTPFLAIRIISDAVDDELPPEIEYLLAQKSLAGKLGAATGAILKRFSAAKDLWRLREEALKASDRLARFLVGVVEQLK
jgi:adenosylhomocysteine nucleosidase